MAKSLLQKSIWMSTGDLRNFHNKRYTPLRDKGFQPAVIHDNINVGIAALPGETGMKAIANNTLFHSDNLRILCEHISDYGAFKQA